MTFLFNFLNVDESWTKISRAGNAFNIVPPVVDNSSHCGWPSKFDLNSFQTDTITIFPHLF